MDATRAKRLLVEGKSDTYFVAELMGCHIPWNRPPPVNIVDCNGGELFSSGRISLELKSDAVVGVLADADDSAQSRWQRLRMQALPFFPDIPEDLPADGLVVSNDAGQRFGVWIMPDNVQDGMLETFIKWLIPQGAEALFSHAESSVMTAKSAYGAKFKDVHLDKAKIHTWLAWMEPPGESFGTAIKARILDPKSPLALPFVSWFRRLFDL